MAAHLSPSRTVITSFTPRRPSLSSGDGAAAFDDGDWVLCLASPHDQHAPSNGTIACAISNGQVLVYDQQRLHAVSTFSQVHGSCLSSQLTYGPQNTILSAGMDGRLVVLDPRQGNGAPVARATLPPGQAALSVSLGYDGYIAAVGSNKARIHFFDIRNTKLLGSYVDSHTDAITSLSFRSPTSATLVSGSEDGLLCVFDTLQSSEDAALKTVLNVGAPARRVGFCDDSSIYCLTGSETASLWNYETATCIHDFGMDLRHQLLQHAPSIESIDYLVDAHFDATSQELLLTAGNAQGGAAIYRLGRQPTQYSNSNQFGSLQWELCNVLEGGHRGVVRDVCHFSPSVILTAGEDARLCEWNRLLPQAHSAKSSVKPVDTAWKQHHPTVASATAATASVGGGGPIRRPRSRQRSGPY